MADVPAPVETNRGPRVRTNSKGIGSFIPPELKETGRRAVNLASAIDPIQGLMRGMSASGRAADTDLSPEERRAAAIEAGVETAAPLAMMGLGSLAKQPVKATVLDILTPTGAPQAVVDDVSDPSRRAFMKGAVATGGIAAIAPDVITEALERVPAAVKKLKPIPNPIDIFTQNMKILRREMEEAYDAADDMPYGSTMSRDYDEASAEAYNEAIQNAEKLAYDLDATTEMDLRELISDIGPKQIAEAADESLEEISQALTDFRMVSEDEYIEQMIPLAEEIQRRGLLEVKDNGIAQYPYARTVVEDVEDYRIGENRASNNSAIIDRPRDLQMMDRDTIPVEDLVKSNQEDRAREIIREALKEEFRIGKENGLSPEQIDTRIAVKRRTLEKEYGIDFSKADGGEMRKGVGSLSETARRMNEGGEAKIDTRSGQEVRQSIRDALKNLNDTEIQDQWGKSRKELKTALDMLILQEYHGEYEPPVTQGVGSLSETARRMNEGGEANINYSLGDIEYRADLEPHMDPLAEMGFDVNKIDYDMMYDRSNDRSQGSHFNPNNDGILISPEDYSSKGVAAHEMRHRGLERLFRIVEQGYPTAKKLGLSKEDYLKILRLYKLDQQQDRQRRVNDPDFEYSDYAHEKIAEGFEKDETINRGAQYFLSNPNAPVFTFDRKERRPTTPAERLALMQDLVRENAMSKEQAFGPDLAIQKSITSPTSMEAFRETGGRAEIDRYLDEGPQNTPENIVEFAEQALAAQRYADIINERNKTIMRNSSEYAMGGEVSGPPPDRGPTPQGIGSLSETARRMNEGGEAKIYIPTQEDLDKMALRVKKTYGFDPVKEALNEGVDPNLALRIMMRESSGDHSKGSDKGAIGLMGLMPITAEDVGVDRTDPFENYVGGLRYLKKMQARFGDVEGIAAYNAGPTAVEKYEGIPPFAETQDYVRAVLTPFTGVDYEDQIQEDAETALMQMPVEMASNVMKRPRARPPVMYDGPRPMQRPTLPQEIIGQPLADLAPPQNLQQKYSLEGIEQMLTGTNSELLLPRQFQQGSPYSSMQ